MNKQITIFLTLLGIFLFAYYLPITNEQVQLAILEAFKMLQWYARFHTLACVVPAMFIAGAIATFLSKEAVLKHLGPKANKVEAYSVASVSGTVLAVCSCSVLPMFAGIYRVGAGLGPAAAFLVSGPAINVMAIFLTARVLGFQLGVTRTIVAIFMSVLIGVLMAVIFRKSEEERTAITMQLPDPPPSKRKLWQTALFMATMIAFLVFSDWVNPGTKLITIGDNAVAQFADGSEKKIPSGVTLNVSVVQETSGDMTVQVQNSVDGFAVDEFQKGDKFTVLLSSISSTSANVPENYRWVAEVHKYRWYLCGVIFAALVIMTFSWVDREEFSEWMANTWDFTKKIVPLLFGGVFVTGFVATLIPAELVAKWVGGNSLSANVIASLLGSLWYFATLTEIPIIQALTTLGMGKGPALALLLAGPTLSLPSIIVIGRYLGVKKTAVFVALVVVFSTFFGMIFGMCVSSSTL
ncbi:MAG: permease [Thermoguttaceae bacterium]